MSHKIVMGGVMIAEVEYFSFDDPVPDSEDCEEDTNE